MREISIIIILIYQKLGSVGPVQQKIKLTLPYRNLGDNVQTKYNIFFWK